MRGIIGSINRYKSSINNFSLYFLTNIIQVVIGLVMNPIWASNLSHKDYAIMGYFDSFGLLILPLVSFSLFSYYAKEYFYLDDKGRKKVLSTLLIFQLVFGLFAMLILLGCLKVYFVTNNISFPFYPYAYLSFVKVYIANVFIFYTLNLKLERCAKKYFAVNMINLCVNTLLIYVFVVFLHKGALGNMFAILLTAIIVSLYSLFKQLKKLQFEFKILKKALSFCWPLILSAILTYFFTGFDKLLLEKVNDVYNFGLYNVGFKFASYFMVFTVAINTTFEPDFYEAIASRNKAKLIKVIILVNSIILIPIFIFIFSSDFVVGILTNFRYVAAAHYSRILVLSNVKQSISFTLSTVIVALGYSRISLVEKMIGTAFTIILYIFLIRNYGFYGAAWGNVLCYLFMSIVSLFILVYLYRNKYYNKLKPTDK